MWEHCPNISTFQVIQQLLQVQLIQQSPIMYQMLTDQISVDQNQHTSNFHLVSAAVAILNWSSSAITVAALAKFRCKHET